MAKWVGEDIILRAFGPEGFKAVCLILLDEINILRAEAGLPARTLSQVLIALGDKIEANASDIEE